MPPSNPDLLRRCLLPKKTPWFESIVESDLSPAMPDGICRICLYPIEGQLSWSPALYGWTSSLQATKNITENSVMSFSCSGSQDVSVATPCLLLILTCSAGACYPRKRHGLNLLWNQICRLPCLAASAVSVCIPLRASSHGLQPYTDGLRPCRQQKNITEDSVMSLSCSGSQD